MFNAVFRLRRDNDYNYNKVKNTFVPEDGELILVDTARSGLRLMCGDGKTPYGALDFVDRNLVQGYYHEEQDSFFKDISFIEELQKNTNLFYVDLQKGTLYYFDGKNYHGISTGAELASSKVPGIMKLYNSTGSNTDGTMTQKAITEELDTKVELTLKEEEELIIFSL